MSHTVWKYPLEATTRQEIEVPWGAKILKLAVLNGLPCLWILVDPAQATISSRDIHLYATGEEIPDASQLEYLGTIAAEQADKPVVLHCFEALRIIV